MSVFFGRWMRDSGQSKERRERVFLAESRGLGWVGELVMWRRRRNIHG